MMVTLPSLVRMGCSVIVSVFKPVKSKNFNVGGHREYGLTLSM